MGSQIKLKMKFFYDIYIYVVDTSTVHLCWICWILSSELNLWFSFGEVVFSPIEIPLPSGKHTNNFGKSPFYSWVNKLFL